ncbi:MAG: type II toxin-antitoxin system RelE/ParE family toxin [Patescibacteria group bacterium]
MYSIITTKKAHKELLQLPKRDRHRIERAIDHLKEEPYAGKHMHGNRKGMFSLRVWPYRVIYTIRHEIITVTIISIGHRKDIYKKIAR